jgi:hypothetical protein
MPAICGGNASEPFRPAFFPVFDAARQYVETTGHFYAGVLSDRAREQTAGPDDPRDALRAHILDAVAAAIDLGARRTGS